MLTYIAPMSNDIAAMLTYMGLSPTILDALLNCIRAKLHDIGANAFDIRLKVFCKDPSANDSAPRQTCIAPMLNVFALASLTIVAGSIDILGLILGLTPQALR